LDLPGSPGKAQKGNGSNVQLWDMDGGNDRKFKFKDAGNGYYYIMPQHCNSRLDVEGCWPDKWFCNHYKNAKGAPIQIWSFDTNDVGKWRLEQVKKGRFMIVNKYSGKALDASAGSINKNGCAVQQWDIHKRDNQLWELISVKTGQRYEK
ncbi:MAG: RICIN domain-containing protein, partial [Marinilabiliaceae bacterium]|nr:RICIN domain-containing protein [Marinilabiliaceae bacterium]